MSSHEVPDALIASEAPGTFSFDALPALTVWWKQQGIQRDVKGLMRKLETIKLAQGYGQAWGAFRSPRVHEEKQQELHGIGIDEAFAETVHQRMKLHTRLYDSLKDPQDRVHFVPWVAATTAYALATKLQQIDDPQLRHSADNAMVKTLEAGFGWSRQAADETAGYHLDPLEYTRARTLASAAMNLGNNGITPHQLHRELRDYIYTSVHPTVPLSDRPAA